MPRKRSNGEGSLHKRANGLWEWQVMVGYQPDGKRKMKSFYGRTQKEVKEKAAKYLEDLRAAPEILSANELAIFLHISRAGAYNLLNSKDFPTLHVGGRKLVTKENVLLWMKKNTNKIA